MHDNGREEGRIREDRPGVGRITMTREDLWKIKKMSNAGVVEDRKEGLEKLLMIPLSGTFSQPCVRSLDSRTSI